MSAEADLWAAFWAKMFQDACECVTFASKTHGGTSVPTRIDAVQAWALLTDTSGAWADQRGYLAGLCGVDPVVIREQALRRGMGEALRASHGEVVAPVVRRSVRQRDPAIMARNAAIAADYAAGLSYVQIAAKHGIRANPEAVRKIARAEGVPPRPPAARTSKRGRGGNLNERGLKIVEYYARGMRGAEIGRIMGLHRDTVDSVIYRWKRAGKLPGSAVEDRGISRAAGGGVVAPFHAQNMHSDEAV